jgi:mRNA interferase RelE/StbE
LTSKNKPRPVRSQPRLEPKSARPWTVEFDDRARRELRKLDSSIQSAILRYLRERIATAEDPRRFGKPLRRNLAGLWRYRVEDYRLICRIEDARIVVLVLQVGHRSEVYED